MKTQLDRIEFDERFWDCECKENYIQPFAIAQCRKCGAWSADQPSSRRDEVVEHLQAFGYPEHWINPQSEIPNPKSKIGRAA